MSRADDFVGKLFYTCLCLLFGVVALALLLCAGSLVALGVVGVRMALAAYGVGC